MIFFKKYNIAKTFSIQSMNIKRNERSELTDYPAFPGKGKDESVGSSIASILARI